MKVTFSVSLRSYSQALVEEELDFDDDISDEELDQEYETWVHEHLDGGWWKERE